MPTLGIPLRTIFGKEQFAKGESKCSREKTWQEALVNAQ
jgi:hypothetical protein